MNLTKELKLAPNKGNLHDLTPVPLQPALLSTRRRFCPRGK